MKTLRFKVVGTQPLMLNNNQTVNPFNHYAKKLKEYTSKRKKTEEDMLALYGLQFESSLYLASDGKTYIIPADHFWAMPGCGRPGLWNCCLRTVCPDNQRIILGLLPNVSYTRVWRAWRLSPGAEKMRARTEPSQRNQ